jgi:hypothetical protein
VVLQRGCDVTQQQRKRVFCALGPCKVVTREANSEAGSSEFEEVGGKR